MQSLPVRKRPASIPASRVSEWKLIRTVCPRATCPVKGAPSKVQDGMALYFLPSCTQLADPTKLEPEVVPDPADVPPVTPPLMEPPPVGIPAPDELEQPKTATASPRSNEIACMVHPLSVRSQIILHQGWCPSNGA
jgi:hypothetical protein